MNEPRFLNGSGKIERHGGKLPHWQQDEVTVFVTFRLADSLPAPELVKLREFKANWLRVNGGRWDEEVEARWQREYASAIDDKLDEGHGGGCLRKPEVRGEVERVLCFGNGSRYRLDAAVVMPNHVHVLFSPQGVDLAGEVQAWKSISSRRIRSKIGEEWPGWQRNYHDRLIRDRRHFGRAVDYILRNGPTANLRENEYWVHLKGE